MSTKEEVYAEIEKVAVDIQRTFGTDHGKRVLERLESANRPGNVFNTDPIEMARRVGAMEIVQGLIGLMETKDG